MEEKLLKLKENDFEVKDDGTVCFTYITIAKILQDGSVNLMVAQNSHSAKMLHLNEFLEIMGNPIINPTRSNDFKRITTVSVMNSIMVKCKQKFGTLGKALEYAANSE